MRKIGTSVTKRSQQMDRTWRLIARQQVKNVMMILSAGQQSATGSVAAPVQAVTLEIDQIHLDWRQQQAKGVEASGERSVGDLSALLECACLEATIYSLATSRVVGMLLY
jgi:hypothetical protein